MAAQDPALLARLRSQGLGAVAPTEGLTILASLLRTSSAHTAQPALALVASPLLWPELLRASAGSRAKDSFYAEFATQPASSGPRAAAAGASAAVGSAAAAARAAHHASQRQDGGPLQRPLSEEVTAAVLAMVRQVVGVEVAVDQGLMEVR